MNGLADLLRRRFRIIVELSSVATIASFLLSAAVLYSMLESIGIPFSALVGTEDVIISGLALLFRAVFVLVVALPIIYTLEIYGISGVRQRLAIFHSAAPWSIKQASSLVMVLVAVAFIPLVIGLVFLNAWAWGTDSVSPLVRSGPFWLMLPLLIFGYGRLIYDIARVLNQKSDAAAEQSLWNAITSDPPGPAALRFYVVSGIVVCTLFATVATYRERISYAKYSTDQIAVSPDLATCKGERARVMWVGVNSVAARCGGSTIILKNVETLGISLRR